MNTEAVKARLGTLRERVDWVTVFYAVAPGIFAFVLGLGLDYTKAQSFTFGASCALFSIWLIDRGGGEVGWFTESIRFRIGICLAFVLIFAGAHFEIAHYGIHLLRPVSALMIATIFLPYAVTTALEMVLGD